VQNLTSFEGQPISSSHIYTFSDTIET